VKTKNPRTGDGRGLDVAIWLPYAEVTRFACQNSDRPFWVCQPTLHARFDLVGETTRRLNLNPHRGSQPVGTRRVVGKREWQRESVKSRRQQDGSVSHQSLHELLQA